MNFEIIKVEGAVVDFRAIFSAEEATSFYKSSLNGFVNSVRVPGFRKGHVPTSRVEALYASDIREDFLANAMKALSADIEKFMRDKDILDVHETIPQPYTKGGELVINFRGETYPAVSEKDISAAKFKEVSFEITDEYINNVVNVLRHNEAKYEKIENGVFGEGTVAYIDFVGKVDGNEFNGNKAENFKLPYSETRMIPGFVSSIAGHKEGESFDINVKFPDDYTAEELRGKEAVFAITIREVQKEILPELDAEFVKKFSNDEELSVEDFLANTRKNLERQAQMVCFEANRESLIKELGKQYSELDIPKSLLRRVISSHLQLDLSKGKKEENEKLLQTAQLLLAPLVSPKLRGELVIYDCLYKSHKVESEVTEEDIKAEAQIDAIAYDDAEEFISECLKKDGEDGLYYKYVDFIRSRRVYEYFRGKVQVEEVKLTSQQYIAGAQTGFGGVINLYDVDENSKQEEPAKEENANA